MLNKAQLSKDRKASKAPKKLKKPKDIDYKSMMGFRDDSPFRDQAVIDINTPTGLIDMSDTGTDLIANGRYLPAYSGMHQFDPGIVTETKAKSGGWLDTYQNGGTRYVSDPKDPRLLAYRDSSELYDNYSKNKGLILTGGKFYPTPEIDRPVKTKKSEKFSIPNPNNPISYHKIDNSFGFNTISDTGLPDINIVRKAGIHPLSTEVYTRKESQYKTEAEYKEAAKRLKSFSEKPGKVSKIDYLIQSYKKPVQPVIYQKPQQQNKPTYADSMALYNKGERDYKEYLNTTSHNRIPEKSTRSWDDPIKYDGMNPAKIQPIKGHGYYFNHDPDVVAETNVPSSEVNNQVFRYKKPVQPVVYKKPKLDTSNWEQSSIDSLNAYNSTAKFKRAIDTIGKTGPTKAYANEEFNRLYKANQDPHYKSNNKAIESKWYGDRKTVEPEQVDDDGKPFLAQNAYPLKTYKKPVGVLKKSEPVVETTKTLPKQEVKVAQKQATRQPGFYVNKTDSGNYYFQVEADGTERITTKRTAEGEAQRLGQTIQEFGSGGAPVIDRLGREHAWNSGYVPKAQNGITYNFPEGMIPTKDDSLLYDDYRRRQVNSDPYMHKRAEDRLHELVTGYDAYKKTEPSQTAWNQYLLELNARKQGALNYVAPPLSPKKKKFGGWLDTYQDGGSKPTLKDVLSSIPQENLTSQYQADKDWVKRTDAAKKQKEDDYYYQKMLAAQESGTRGVPIESVPIELAFMPAARGLGWAGNLAADAITGSMRTGALSKAYKVNPWAFKPHPEGAYRMLGKEGYKDALLSGEIRSLPGSAHKDAHFWKGEPLDARNNTELMERLGHTGYEGPYMAEQKYGTWQGFKDLGWNTDFDKDVWQNRVLGNIKIDDPRLTLYKQDWLRGYKKVPKELPGSPNNIYDIKKAGFPNPVEILNNIIPDPAIFPMGNAGLALHSSPMNLIPGYGKRLSGKGQAFRKFGNSIEDVMERQALSPKGGSKFRMGAKQIESEGNWAAMNEPDEMYNSVFEATANRDVPGSNLSFHGERTRNGVLIKDKVGNTLSEIPLTEPGLSFNRRLPFSSRYIPVNKQKLIDKQFQLSTQLPNVQRLAEKYAAGLGIAGAVGLISGTPKESMQWYNEHTVIPAHNFVKKHLSPLTTTEEKKLNKKYGGSKNWLDDYNT